jgi:hypothetical protein
MTNQVMPGDCLQADGCMKDLDKFACNVQFPGSSNGGLLGFAGGSDLAATTKAMYLADERVYSGCLEGGMGSCEARVNELSC